jgi:hypothetical protein
MGRLLLGPLNSPPKAPIWQRRAPGATYLISERGQPFCHLGQALHCLERMLVRMVGAKHFDVTFVGFNLFSGLCYTLFQKTVPKGKALLKQESVALALACLLTELIDCTGEKHV